MRGFLREWRWEIRRARSADGDELNLLLLSTEIRNDIGMTIKAHAWPILLGENSKTSLSSCFLTSFFGINVIAKKNCSSNEVILCHSVIVS